jgi:hypothetical protein
VPYRLLEWFAGEDGEVGGRLRAIVALHCSVCLESRAREARESRASRERAIEGGPVPLPCSQARHLIRSRRPPVHLRVEIIIDAGLCCSAHAPTVGVLGAAPGATCTCCSACCCCTSWALSTSESAASDGPLAGLHEDSLMQQQLRGISREHRRPGAALSGDRTSGTPPPTP